MELIFLRVFNMSAAAVPLILIALILWPLLSRTPKVVRLLPWCIVALRLFSPFFFSAGGLFYGGELIGQDVLYSRSPALDTGIQALDRAINQYISGSLSPLPGASVNPLQLIFGIGGYIWLFGAVAVLIFGIIRFFYLSRKRDRAFTITATDAVSFLLLALHWFNPLVWTAYFLVAHVLHPEKFSRRPALFALLATALCISLSIFTLKAPRSAPSSMSAAELMKMPASALYTGGALLGESEVLSSYGLEWGASPIIIGKHELLILGEDNSVIFRSNSVGIESVPREELLSLVKTHGMNMEIPEYTDKNDMTAYTYRNGESVYIVYSLKDTPFMISVGNFLRIYALTPLDAEVFPHGQCVYMNPLSSVFSHNIYDIYVLKEKKLTVIDEKNSVSVFDIDTSDWQTVTSDEWNGLFRHAFSGSTPKFPDGKTEKIELSNTLWLLKNRGKYFIADIRDNAETGSFAWSLYSLMHD